MNPDQLKLEIRKQYGGYAALAEEIGVTEQAISHIVTGKTTAATSRYAVASALGMDVADIWPEEGREPAVSSA